MRLYRALLRVYPRSFRQEYGTEMEGIFRARRRQSSGLAVVMLWAEAVTDTVINGARVHWDQLTQDIRYSLRSLSHARGFAFTAVIVAALGTGATTTTFSVADHVLMRPLPFPDSDRLVMVWQNQQARGYSRIELSIGNYQDLKARNRSLSGLAAFTSTPVNLVGHGNAERLDATLVTPDLFSVLGVHAAHGRALMAADGEPSHGARPRTPTRGGDSPGDGGGVGAPHAPAVDRESDDRRDGGCARRTAGLDGNTARRTAGADDAAHS